MDVKFQSFDLSTASLIVPLSEVFAAESQLFTKGPADLTHLFTVAQRGCRAA